MSRVLAVDASGVIDGVLDLVFPKRCVVCRASGAWLCEPCVRALQALPADRCPRCGAPRIRAAATTTWRAAGAAPEGRRPSAPCRECRGRELAFASASAAFVYEGSARALVLRSAQLVPALRTPPPPKPARCRFSSRGSPPITVTASNGVSTRRNYWHGGWHVAPAFPALRCFSGGETAPARAGWTAPRGRRTSAALSRCGRMSTGY